LGSLLAILFTRKIASAGGRLPRAAVTTVPTVATILPQLVALLPLIPLFAHGASSSLADGSAPVFPLHHVGNPVSSPAYRATTERAAAPAGSRVRRRRSGYLGPAHAT